MICWYCYWGWPEQVFTIYQKAIQDINNILDDTPCEENDWTYPDMPTDGKSALEFGPGHIVWSDENFDEGCIDWCLTHAVETVPCNDWHPTALERVFQALRELRAVPEEVRCCEPEDYDGEHPENFPPPAGLTMIKRE